MSVPLHYSIPEGMNEEEILGSVGSDSRYTRTAHHQLTYRILDTFDWLLHFRGLSLVQQDDELRLIDARTGSVDQTTKQTRQSAPRFAWDFSRGPFRDRLSKIIDVRALLTKATITSVTNEYAFLNVDGKTVVRVASQTGTVATDRSEPVRFSILTLVPLRGYEDKLQRMASALRILGLSFIDRGIDDHLLRLGGAVPGSYTSKPSIPLDPALPAQDAAKAIFRFLAGVIRTNMDGVLGDIDTEFLHDLRVAVRRTRSAISELRHVLPPAEIERYKDDLAILGRATNNLRDLDVYLIQRDHFRSMLPDELVPGLNPFFRSLTAQRRTELRRIRRTLRSDFFRSLMFRWEGFIAEDGPHWDGKHSSQPISSVAKRALYRRYNRIMRTGLTIRHDSPLEEYHVLRILCKKLRYLLEFFSSLFPEEDIHALILKLKLFQKTLGEFNDLTVQQRRISEFLGTLPTDDDLRTTAAAMGGLLAMLHARQIKLRDEFFLGFGEFSAPETVALFEKLLLHGEDRSGDVPIGEGPI